MFNFFQCSLAKSEQRQFKFSQRLLKMEYNHSDLILLTYLFYRKLDNKLEENCCQQNCFEEFAPFYITDKERYQTHQKNYGNQLLFILRYCETSNSLCNVSLKEQRRKLFILVSQIVVSFFVPRFPALF